MRNMDQCKAEMFGRSEEKIRNRKKTRNRILCGCIPLVLCCVMRWAVLPALQPVGRDTAPEAGYPEGQKEYAALGDNLTGAGGVLTPPESVGEPMGFSFRLTWGCYGESSYDSHTGRLVKTTNATNPQAYVTEYHLTAAQWEQVRRLIEGLDIKSYPDIYDPNRGVISSPSMTLILTVSTDEGVKTVAAENIALSYESGDPKGQAFLDVCRQIRQILTDTQAWRALPDYEFYYD